MKVGVLTLPFNNNYGGYLQAFALMSVLKHLGVDAELILRRHNLKPLRKRALLLTKNIVKTILGRKPRHIIPNPEENYVHRGTLMLPFVRKYITPCTKACYSYSELKKICQAKYDVCIAGSDQLWRPDYVPDVREFFFSFLNEGTKRISYAASFGVESPQYTVDQIKSCGVLLKKFDAVSLREIEGFSIIKRMGWKTTNIPKLVLDPTMLLEKEDYLSLIFCEKEDLKPNVFCYILDANEEVYGIIDEISSCRKISPKFIIDPKQWKSYLYVMPAVETWLAGIRDASFVVTDSFHGTVFSIIFNKPFVVYANKERGENRFITLLKYFGLGDRIVHDKKDVLHSLEKKIQWEKVNKILEEKRKESIEYLRTSIGL